MHNIKSASLIFIHIPKAAGTTLNKILHKNYRRLSIFEIDTNSIDEINFSKGICNRCRRIYEIRHMEYKPDLNFEVIKLKLGIKV